MATSQHGGLKRKYGFPDEDAVYSSSSPSSHSDWDSEEDSSRMDRVDPVPASSFSSSHHIPTSSILKKMKISQSKRSVSFGPVTVLFFQRCQGFSSVPSHGGCTLGMLRWHTAQQQFTLTEHAEEQQRLRLERLRERQQEAMLEAFRKRVILTGILTETEAASLTTSDVPDEDNDHNTEPLNDLDSLRPYSSRQRRALLRASGVLRIDREEKLRLQELRRSREDCGCHCQGSCQPQTCSCSQAGISCQMDRSGFPCGCSKECCGNPAGRIEFNSARVRSHCLHTLTKLKPDEGLLGSNRLTDAEQEPPKKKRDRSLPAGAVLSFHKNPEDFCQGENRCSSHTSWLTSISLESDAESSKRPTEELEDSRLPHIVSFSDSDVDGCPFVQEFDLSSDLTHTTHANTHPETSRCSPQLECLHENTSRASLECANDPFDFPALDQTIYMDLSFSSDLDLLFFDTFHEYSSIQTHFKVYSQMEHFSALQFSRCPSPALIEDSGINLLEALVGIS